MAKVNTLKKDVQKVGGLFRPNTSIAKLFLVLKPGKALQAKPLEKKFGQNRLQAIQRLQKKGGWKLIRQDGTVKLQMSKRKAA
jgi:hypothetical protein